MDGISFADNKILFDASRMPVKTGVAKLIKCGEYISVD
jgi:hypothetical protein